MNALEMWPYTNGKGDLNWIDYEQDHLETGTQELHGRCDSYIEMCNESSCEEEVD